MPTHQAEAASAAVGMLIDNGAVDQAVYVATNCRCSPDAYERVLKTLQRAGENDQHARDRIAEGELSLLLSSLSLSLSSGL